MVEQQTFKYKRKCKLPSCRKPFKTNRDWQEFHDPACQQKWQKLLRRSHEDVIVEMALLKEDVKKIEKELGIKS